MPTTLRERLTYANVMATIAVFIALGGSSYAAVKINGKNIRDRTVAAAKLKRDTVTGRELREASLGRVPAAAVATTAGSAGAADNADRLDGQDSSSFRVGCPAGSTRAVGACFENQARATSGYISAGRTCGAADARLPTLFELDTFATLPGVSLGTGNAGLANYEWTAEAFVTTEANAWGVTDYTGTSAFSNFKISEQLSFRCVRPLTN